MWRPEGHVNPYEHEHKVEGEWKLPCVLYDEGFDACLEALKGDTENAERCEAGEWIETVATRGDEIMAGWWVFVPEEKE